MQIVFDRSFSKSLDKLKNKAIKLKTVKLIEKIEEADNLQELANMKKLEGFKNFYRIRIGDYRLGIEQESESQIRFIVIAHRKDVYKLFP